MTISFREYFSQIAFEAIFSVCEIVVKTMNP